MNTPANLEGTEGGASNDQLDGNWQKEAIKSYFRERPCIYVDTVDLMEYFKVASILEAAEDLIQEGWLKRINTAFPKMYQHGV